MKRLLGSILVIALLMTSLSFAADKNPIVRMETSHGDVFIELLPKKAPKTVENFLKYVENGHYDGTIFHRVIPEFMIQGGGFTPKMQQKQTLPPVKNEAKNGLKNLKYTVAMARTNVIDSATSQFFINTKHNHFLNFRDESRSGYGYAVFGRVIHGFKVVDQIEKVKTMTLGPYQNVPMNPVIIKKMSLKR